MTWQELYAAIGSGAGKLGRPWNNTAAISVDGKNVGIEIETDKKNRRHLVARPFPVCGQPTHFLMDWDAY